MYACRSITPLGVRRLWPILEVTRKGNIDLMERYQNIYKLIYNRLENKNKQKPDSANAICQNLVL